MKLLYICRANIIRGPAAEIITEKKNYTEKWNITDLVVSSAGINYTSYPGIKPEMKEALKRLGYPSKQHTPRKVTEDLLYEQDLILCMTGEQVKEISERFPRLKKEKINTLFGYAGLSGEIDDPHGLVGRIQLFSMLEKTPHKFRQLAYYFFGKTDPRDYEGIIRMYEGIAKKIEKGVDGVLEKMIGKKGDR